MPNAIICLRPDCHNLVLNLEEAHGLERYTYSAKKGVPRKQTLDDYLCNDCNTQLNTWLGVNEKGQILDTGPQRVLERYNHALSNKERGQADQDSGQMRTVQQGSGPDQGGQ